MHKRLWTGTTSHKETDMATLFMLIAGMDYEPDHIDSCYTHLTSALAAAETLKEKDMASDTVSVKVISDGPGGGITIISWRAEWVEPLTDDDPCCRTWRMQIV